MNDLIIILIVGIVLGIIKYVLMQERSKKLVDDRLKNESVEKNMFHVLKPILKPAYLVIICSILLGNSDDKVSDALNYIKPSKHLNGILEKING